VPRGCEERWFRLRAVLVTSDGLEALGTLVMGLWANAGLDSEPMST
jgi:hypothetical protein